MSEYEALSLSQVYIANGIAVLANLFTVLGAYLVAGFLAAHRISFRMSLFVTALFLAFALNSMLVMMGLGGFSPPLVSTSMRPQQQGKAFFGHPRHT